MQAEVISIGDELTSGQRLDTNSQWLSERLGELGVRVMFHTTVADDLPANVAVFRQAASRADVVVATGGLGPTADDLTREALAEMIGAPLVLDEESLAHITALFARRNRPMPDRNRVQAMFPAGSRPIPNPHGSAPGVDLEVPRGDGTASRIFALPGVPAEMKPMWHESVVPALRELGAGRRVIRHRRVKCFGVGESDLEQMLPDLIRRGRTPSVGITVSEATITLRITAEGDDDAQCEALIGPTAATIRECLGTLVFGDEDDELEHVVARMLAAGGRTLSTVEWGTGGLVAERLGHVQGPTGYRGGLVVSSPDAVGSLLVSATDEADEPGWHCWLAQQCSEPAGNQGNVSPNERNDDARLVGAMAAACRERMGTDLALAIGPFPADSPDGGNASETASRSTIHFGLASREVVRVESSSFAAHPAIQRPRAAKQALNLVRLELLALQAGAEA